MGLLSPKMRLTLAVGIAGAATLGGLWWRYSKPKPEKSYKNIISAEESANTEMEESLQEVHQKDVCSSDTSSESSDSGCTDISTKETMDTITETTRSSSDDSSSLSSDDDHPSPPDKSQVPSDEHSSLQEDIDQPSPSDNHPPPDDYQSSPTDNRPPPDDDQSSPTDNRPPPADDDNQPSSSDNCPPPDDGDDDDEEEDSPSDSDSSHDSYGQESTEKRRISLDDFTFFKLLGEGSFGRVFLAASKRTHRLYAVKVLKKDVLVDFEYVESTKTERKVLILGKGHPFITQLSCCFQSNDSLFFVMECLYGDLQFYIHSLGSFDEAQTRFYAAEIVSALIFLHQHGIIHRDIKPDNVLMDKEGHCKLTDFGMCIDGILNGVMASSSCGTPAYTAPEAQQAQPKYGPSVDWWSLGIVMFQMMTGRRPLTRKAKQELYLSFFLSDDDDVSYPDYISEEAVNILKALLTKDPEKRLGCVKSQGGENSIKRDPFFKELNWNRLEERKITPPFKPNIEISCSWEEMKLSKACFIEKCYKNAFPDFSYCCSDYKQHRSKNASQSPVAVAVPLGVSPYSDFYACILFICIFVIFWAILKVLQAMSSVLF